ncbi:hypothetical protein AB0958_11055 [Streptomyces sp. NPDC006655]|uniref:hypothetical protein n=1 Tax=Streptomyces sp. NPDC006655 TaxID=3156898 RepID=UPI00345412CA
MTPVDCDGTATAVHLARPTFWSADRDRPWTGGSADSCSGVGQSNRDHTRVLAAYTARPSGPAAA